MKIKKKMLLIAYQIPPIGGSHAIRLVNFIKYFYQYGWKIDVLTANPSPGYSIYDGKNLTALVSGISVYRTYPGVLHKLFYAKKKVLDYQKLANRGFVPSFPKRILRKFEAELVIPDRMAEWIPFAFFQGLRLIKDENYSLLLSSSYPFSCHLIAYLLYKVSHLPWVADYGDPCALAPWLRRNRLKLILEKRLEQTLLADVKAVLVTTRQTKELYLSKYHHLDSTQVHVISNGYDPEEFAGIPSKMTDELSLIYTGNVYHHQTQLAPFFEALKIALNTIPELKKILKVTFVGHFWKKEIIPSSVREFIKFIEFVDFRKALTFMRTARVLVIWGAMYNLCLPGKVYYYLGAKRPILAILNSKFDPLKDLLPQLNRGFVVANKVDEIVKVLYELYKLYQNRSLDTAFSTFDVPDFFWKNIVGNADDILSKIVGD